MKLYICNKKGKRAKCVTQCPHGIPHELLECDGEKCNRWSVCAGYNDKGEWDEIICKCKPYKKEKK